MLILVLLYVFLAINAQAVEVRKFSAAPRASSLRRRDLDFEPNVAVHKLLFDEESQKSAACAHLVPKHPTLILDDISDHINEVTCSPSTISVQFRTEEVTRSAVKAWSTKNEFVLVSTHASCAIDGEYQAYLVNGSSLQISSNTILLTATIKSLNEVTHKISVELGNNIIPEIEPRLKRRQPTTTTSIASLVMSDYQTASLSPTVSFNFQTPTALPVGTKSTNNIDFSRVNKTVLPPDQAIIDMFPGTEPPPFVNLSCRECTVDGTVTLEAAGFDINSNPIGEAIDFFDNGYLQFTVDRLAAHMAIEVALKNGFTGAPFTANLVKIPLTPIAIPGIVTFGPILELAIPMTVTLNSPVNFTTGFDLMVPDNSKIIMNVSDITGSSQMGFDQSKIKPLPFGMEADNLSFNVSAALRPKLTISASVGNTNFGLGVNGGVAAFLDLPKVISRIDLLSNVNSTCDGPAPNGVKNRGIRVTPTATLDVGLHWEMELGVGKIAQNRDGEQVLASKTFPLPNQCLIFDAR